MSVYDIYRGDNMLGRIKEQQEKDYNKKVKQMLQLHNEIVNAEHSKFLNQTVGFIPALNTTLVATKTR